MPSHNNSGYESKLIHIRSNVSEENINADGNMIGPKSQVDAAAPKFYSNPNKDIEDSNDEKEPSSVGLVQSSKVSIYDNPFSIGNSEKEQIDQ